MRILITGSSGLIGASLASDLARAGDEVVRLVRTPQSPGSKEVFWDPALGRIDREGLADLDAVVHLAGESIAKGRWTKAKKRRIQESRIEGTRLLSDTLSKLDHPPRVLICASAVGYYGDRGSERLDENAGVGEGFLARVCSDWEAAAQPAREAGIRVVHLRFGVILSPRGGALAAMLVPFRLGLGGRMGSGDQFMSWIALDDAVALIRHGLATETLSGPVNAVSPNPVTNREFTRTLGAVLRRPTIFPMPRTVARLLLGEMANELLLSGARVVPAKLQDAGYKFLHPELEETLRTMLGSAKRGT